MSDFTIHRVYPCISYECVWGDLSVAIRWARVTAYCPAKFELRISHDIQWGGYCVFMDYTLEEEPVNDYCKALVAKIAAGQWQREREIALLVALHNDIVSLKNEYAAVEREQRQLLDDIAYRRGEFDKRMADYGAAAGDLDGPWIFNLKP